LNNQTIEKGEHNSEEMKVEREKPVRRLPASRLLSFDPARGAFAFYPRPCFCASQGGDKKRCLRFPMQSPGGQLRFSMCFLSDPGACSDRP
jgi:hypothetical protein